MYTGVYISIYIYVLLYVYVQIIHIYNQYTHVEDPSQNVVLSITFGIHTKHQPAQAPPTTPGAQQGLLEAPAQALPRATLALGEDRLINSGSK